MASASPVPCLSVKYLGIPLVGLLVPSVGPRPSDERQGGADERSDERSDRGDER